MQNAEALTKEQIQEFLKGSQGFEFSGENRAERYRWVEQVLVAQEYAAKGKKQRGGIRAYIGKMTGLSLAQVTRLIGKYRTLRIGCGLRSSAYWPKLAKLMNLPQTA
jgi:hypothetical protein